MSSKLTRHETHPPPTRLARFHVEMVRVVSTVSAGRQTVGRRPGPQRPPDPRIVSSSYRPTPEAPRCSTSSWAPLMRAQPLSCERSTLPEVEWNSHLRFRVVLPDRRRPVQLFLPWQRVEQVAPALRGGRKPAGNAGREGASRLLQQAARHEAPVFTTRGHHSSAPKNGPGTAREPPTDSGRVHGLARGYATGPSDSHPCRPDLRRRRQRSRPPPSKKSDAA